MATAAGVIITDVLQKVRDPQGSGHSRSLVLELLGHAQRIANAIFGVVKVTNTLTTEHSRQAYPIQSNLTDNLRITSVTHDSQELSPETLRSLQGHDARWPRTFGERILGFAPVGRDLLILYPALNRASSVSVTSIKDTGVIVGESTNMELPDSRVKIAKDITELLLLIRQRDFDEAEALLKNVTERVQGRER